MVAKTQEQESERTWQPTPAGLYVLFGVNGAPTSGYLIVPTNQDKFSTLFNSNAKPQVVITAPGQLAPVYDEAKRGTWDVTSIDEDGAANLVLFINGREWHKAKIAHGQERAPDKPHPFDVAG